jgi:hypothetical protein
VVVTLLAGQGERARGKGGGYERRTRNTEYIEDGRRRRRRKTVVSAS